MNNITIEYEKPIQVTLDLDELIEVIKKGDINVHYRDNIQYYLKQIGFKDADYLEENAIDYICDKLYSILGEMNYA